MAIQNISGADTVANSVINTARDYVREAASKEGEEGKSILVKPLTEEEGKGAWINTYA